VAGGHTTGCAQHSCVLPGAHAYCCPPPPHTHTPVTLSTVWLSAASSSSLEAKAALVGSHSSRQRGWPALAACKQRHRKAHTASSSHQRVPPKTTCHSTARHRPLGSHAPCRTRQTTRRPCGSTSSQSLCTTPHRLHGVWHRLGPAPVGTCGDTRRTEVSQQQACEPLAQAHTRDCLARVLRRHSTHKRCAHHCSRALHGSVSRK
jgi:hypothetical protein